MEKRNGILSLIFGILAYIPLVGFILGPFAIVFGIIGINKIDGKGYAIVGLILGICAIILNVLFFIFVIIPLLLVAFITTTCFAACGASAS